MQNPKLPGEANAPFDVFIAVADEALVKRCCFERGASDHDVRCEYPTPWQAIADSGRMNGSAGTHIDVEIILGSGQDTLGIANSAADDVAGIGAGISEVSAQEIAVIRGDVCVEEQQKFPC